VKFSSGWCPSHRLSSLALTSLLPRGPPNTVSGDYYDAFLRDRGAGETARLLCVVADVAGKSIPAALLMATIQASLANPGRVAALAPRNGAGAESLCLRQQP
jgi:hypothetical protein